MMQSPRQVLNDLWVHGADARITREGRLRVEPASQLPVELVEAIRADISGLITELRSGWTPEKEGWSRVPTDRVPPALNTTPEWWERLLTSPHEESVEDRRQLLVFHQLASLPTARNLADQHVKYDNFFRIEIRRWHAEERALRNEGLSGCVGGDDCVCPPEAPVRCQVCVRSS